MAGPAQNDLTGFQDVTLIIMDRAIWHFVQSRGRWSLELEFVEYVLEYFLDEDLAQAHGWLIQ